MLIDPVTDLGNRLMMQREMRTAIENATATNSGFAVALLNLDGFRKVNDALGHDVGDELLSAVGKRIRSVLRGGDTVARLGGDDFVILMPALKSESEAGMVAARLLASMRHPLRLGGKTLHVSSSIGIAMYPAHGASEAAMLKYVIAAMNQAKSEGKNTYRLYTSDLGVQSERTMSVERNMYEAIRDGEFMLHYQPICDTKTRGVCAVESLMRWMHKGRMVSPLDFIPVAEENGLIHLLGAWALRTAAMQLARWDSLGIHLQYVTVNVSPIQFLHEMFSENVKKALEDSGIRPERLMLEITESSLMRQPEKARTILEEITQIGVRFAIDDFGTGYSNLGNLKRFPLTCLKIDRSFVKDTPGDPEDCAIVSLVLALAHELGLVTVAEGVETEAQRQFLADSGCGLIQGWLVSKAVDPDVFEDDVKSGTLRLCEMLDKQSIQV
jgi:diguanylate cyclase (GGDEF)-like protein